MAGKKEPALVKGTHGTPQELANALGVDLYRRAYQEGVNLSVWLEMEDPSDQYNDGTDAFERMLDQLDIRAESIPELGVYATRWDRIWNDAQLRAIIPEWASREWRSAQRGRRYSTRALYMSNDSALGSVENAYNDALTGDRWDQVVAPAIPIAELIAVESRVDGPTFRTYYLVYDEDELRMVRVSEGAEVPAAKLVSGQREVSLYKYGRRIDITYETLRRMPLDKVGLHIAKMAVQAEVDKLAAIIDVLVNGDGNANSAAEVFNLTTLDPDATAGTLTLRAWLAFKRKFSNPYSLTTALMQDDVAGQLELLNVGSANVQLVTIAAQAGFGGLTAINPALRTGVRYGWTDDAPALKIVALDNRWAVERASEIGSNIAETARVIERQVEMLVLTEVEGFAVFDNHAARVLNINA